MPRSYSFYSWKFVSFDQHLFPSTTSHWKTPILLCFYICLFPFNYTYKWKWGFPGGANGIKNPPANAGDTGDLDASRFFTTGATREAQNTLWLFFNWKKFYLFTAALNLLCWEGFSPVAASGGNSVVAVWGLIIAVASVLQSTGSRACSRWAQ